MLNIVFESTILVEDNINRNATRGGLYFVAFNIARLLLNNKNVNMYFYTSKYELNIVKYWINKIFPDSKIYIINEESTEWLYIDIFYSTLLPMPNFLDNIKSIKKYVFLHDIIPIILPKYYSIDERDNWYNILINNNKKYDYCFSNSNNTKNDFLKYLPNSFNDRIYVTHLGIENRFSPKEYNVKVLEKYNITKDKKFIFTLCGFDPRKNLIRIVDTFFKFVDKNDIRDMIFIIGGYQSRKLFKEEFDTLISKYGNKIIKLGYVDDEDVPYLYSMSEWFVYTSEYEGFGLPPLEAMACGCPVITSNNSSLPEVVGDAGIMIDWDSDEQHIEAYEKYYFDKEYRKEMSKRGLERSKLFSWEKCTNKMLEVMNDNFVKKDINYIKLGYIKYIRVFDRIFSLPNLFSITNSSDNRFKIIKILFIKISIKNKKNK